MSVDEALALEAYTEVAAIHESHGVFLVQERQSRKFYVKKVLHVYSLDVYRQLQRAPIPNTPRIYHAVESGGTLTVIEEYIPGDTLEEILARGTLPESRVIAISIALCDILSSFHSCSPPIVNRDIKPSNIKITPDGVVKLVDLNAAKPCRSDASRDTVLIGTQGYAAPEQYGFGPSSVLTDIYAMGVLMNVMLTGELPGVSPAFGRMRPIIAACTELTPSRRYQSAAALKAALQGNSQPGSGPRSWRRFLPPGFRHNNPLKWVLATIGYSLMLFLCATLETENTAPAAILLDRVGAVAAFMVVVLFSANYLDVQRYVPGAKSRNLVVRIFCIVAMDFLLFLSAICATALLEVWFTGAGLS